jgi:hypothetical protein
MDNIVSDRDVLTWSGWANVAYTAISSEPQPIASEWPRVPSEESLQPQALHQVTPTRLAEVQISIPPYQYAKARSDHEVNPEQRHVDQSQCSEWTEMAAQYSSNGCDDAVHSSQTRPASSITNSEGSSVEHISLDGTKRHSVSILCRAQLPSSDPVEQIPPKEATLSLEALPGATRNGQCGPARPVGAVTESSRGRACAKGPAGQQKRHLGEHDTRAQVDGDAARAAKRPKLQAIYSTASGRAYHSVAKTKLDRRSPCSSSEDELAMTPTKPIDRRPVRTSATRRHDSRRASSPSTPARKQSQHDSISQGGSRRRQPITPRTQPSTHVSSNLSSDADHCENALGERSFGLSLPAGQMQKDDCDACGFSARCLLQMTDRAWRWLPKDDAVFEALFKNKGQLVDAEKCAVMLRLCLGTIRDYGRELDAAGTQPDRPVHPIVILPGPGDTEMVDSVLPSSNNVSSDVSGDSQCDSTIPESPNDSGDSDATSVGRRSQNCGKRARWTSLEECRLKTWMTERPWAEEDKWHWIAVKLRRSESAVKQHWMIMNQK